MEARFLAASQTEQQKKSALPHVSMWNVSPQVLMTHSWKQMKQELYHISESEEIQAGVLAFEGMQIDGKAGEIHSIIRTRIKPVLRVRFGTTPKNSISPSPRTLRNWETKYTDSPVEFTLKITTAEFTDVCSFVPVYALLSCVRACGCVLYARSVHAHFWAHSRVYEFMAWTWRQNCP